MDSQENRTESRHIQIARATAVFLVLVVMGYAISTQVESAIDTSTPAAATASAQQDATPAPYFPAQYVNQGTRVEEHIQAF